MLFVDGIIVWGLILPGFMVRAKAAKNPLPDHSGSGSFGSFIKDLRLLCASQLFGSGLHAGQCFFLAQIGGHFGAAAGGALFAAQGHAQRI